MRQVTGSNSTSTDKKVSIQLRLDGHSFSRDILLAEIAEKSVARAGAEADAKEEDIVEVELLTAKTIMVPEECFEPDLAAKLLRMSGIICSNEELPVWSRPCDGAVAVMALNREVAQVLNESFGACVEYSSPILRQCTVQSQGQEKGSGKIEGVGPYLYIYSDGNVAYFKLYEGAKLRLCEVISLTGEDDMLCMVESIIRECSLAKPTIFVEGTSSDGVIKLLKQYHKVQKCE
ncbi:MAG: DUF3822 family protein [Alistipes sp.]|nr:DUF3822 family protein [Alistipes sp.]